MSWSSSLLDQLLREPYQSEDSYFRQSPHVGGMATEDGRVVLNPHSPLNAQERQAVGANEVARLSMRNMPTPPPPITPTQQSFLNTVDNGNPYAGGDPTSQWQTIIGRLLSDDPSAGDVTQEQRDYASKVKATSPNLVNRNTP